MASFAPGLRRLAVRASPSLFVCRQCQRQQPQWRSSPSRVLDTIVRSQQQTRSFNQTKAPLNFSSNAVIADKPSSSIAAQAVANATKATKKSAWPETNSKSVGYWLVGSAVSVFGIVVWGGLTRLTESG